MVAAAIDSDRALSGQFLELNPNPLLVLSSNGHISYANRAARIRFPGLHGVEDAHPIFGGLSEMLPQLSDRREQLVVFAREVTHAAAIYDQQILALPAEGAIYLYMTDVTARKRAEEELRQAHARLEERVAQRTAELARSNKDLEEFAYAASHDLRSPLRAISTIIEWLREGLSDRLDDESRAQMDLLLNRVVRLDKMVEDLLQYSRAGHQLGKIQMVDTEDLVEEILELLPIPEGFEVRKTSALPRLSTASVPLQQVLRNLISNSLKHHDRAHGRIEVSAAEAGDFYEFSVSDDGPGIPPDCQERVFRLFETLKPRDTVEGSGIGLAIVKRTVEKLGGTIRVACDGSRGTTFRFTWPREIAVASARQPQ